MSNELIPFEFNGAPIRVIKDEQGEPEFVARDVCNILGYMEPSHAVKRHCKHARVLKTTETDGFDFGPRGVLVISESDLYRLTLRTKMPDAENFQDWVVEVVLPRIRKTGVYIFGEEKMTGGDELIAAALLAARRKIYARERIIAEQTIR